MRKTMMLAMLAAAGIAFGPAPALAVESCPPGQVLKCRRWPPNQPPRCWCVEKPGPWVAPGGKAEIHKKNVPTVKPNKSPGPND